MRKVSVFNFITLNGYFKGTDGDTSWHRHGMEENEFAVNMLQSGNTLLFGRVTYEMMSGYWPTPMALEQAPALAKGMNEADKIVFSNTLKKAEWNKSEIIKDMIPTVRKMKQESGKDMTILGSGSIITQLAEEGLIDTYEIMIDPVALGEGTPIFHQIKQPLNLQLLNTRTFKSGVVLLSYASEA